MKFTNTACAVALLLASASAQAFVIDLEGEEVDGAAFKVFTVNNASTDPVLFINFAFVYEAGANGNDSWGSELLVQLSHLPTQNVTQIGTNGPLAGCDIFASDCDYDLQWAEESGLFTASGSFNIASAIAEGSGDWEILLADSFDDDGIDGRFLAGSYIELSSVPVPAAVWFMGSALLSLFGVRRLRKT